MLVRKAYIPGKPWKRKEPLARYLPRLGRGIVDTWLKENIPSGSWVIDPFGATPRLAIEAAQAGYRVLVAANNPVTRFLLEMAAQAPSKEKLGAALSDLAATRKGDERLEPHILSIYTTECDHCGREVSAEAYLWRRDDKGPYARIYTCPHCEHQGEFPTTQADIEKAAKYSNNSMHRARALERIAATNSPERVFAEDALSVYPARAIYVLSTLINKIDSVSTSPERKQALSALLLSTFDRANTLWRYPSERARPRQLTIPSQYRENNIWFAIENAIAEWSSDHTEVDLIRWPEEPPKRGGISIFDGRIKDLAETLGQVEISAVISAFPRPNQAYWTLSALWTGWLWGQEALGQFASVLRRRRYEWAWHTNALQTALNRLGSTLREGTPFFGLVTESEAGFDAATMIAAEISGFELDYVAVRPASKQTQLHWMKRTKKARGERTGEGTEFVREAAIDLFKEFGQPAEYLRLQAAALLRMARYDQIRGLGETSADIYTEGRSIMELGLTFHSGFLRYGGRESSLDSGQWWPRGGREFTLPLADRLEKELVKFMIKNPGSNFHHIESAMCSTFPGLLTPEHALIKITAESYGRETDDSWKLRPADIPEARRADLKEIKQLLIELGNHLGYKVLVKKPLAWQDENGEVVRRFNIIASAMLGEIVMQEEQGKNMYIVLPGGRASLVLHKLESDPHIEEEISRGWQFLKFRHVRRLAENPTITRESIDELLGLDQLQRADPQIPLL